PGGGPAAAARGRVADAQRARRDGVGAGDPRRAARARRVRPPRLDLTGPPAPSMRLWPARKSGRATAAWSAGGSVRGAVRRRLAGPRELRAREVRDELVDVHARELLDDALALAEGRRDVLRHRGRAVGRDDGHARDVADRLGGGAHDLGQALDELLDERGLAVLLQGVGLGVGRRGLGATLGLDRRGAGLTLGLDTGREGDLAVPLGLTGAAHGLRGRLGVLDRRGLVRLGDAGALVRVGLGGGVRGVTTRVRLLDLGVRLGLGGLADLDVEALLRDARLLGERLALLLRDEAVLLGARELTRGLGLGVRAVGVGLDRGALEVEGLLALGDLLGRLDDGELGRALRLGLGDLGDLAGARRLGTAEVGQVVRARRRDVGDVEQVDLQALLREVGLGGL